MQPASALAQDTPAAAAGIDTEAASLQAANAAEQPSDEAVSDAEARSSPEAAASGTSAPLEAAPSAERTLQEDCSDAEAQMAPDAVATHVGVATDIEARYGEDIQEPEATSSEAVREAGAKGAGAASAAEADIVGLPPDHPLLRRAQDALHRQLAADKLRLQEELRERRKALKAGAARFAATLCTPRTLPPSVPATYPTTR
jgi:hypothetical protein